MNFVIHTVKGCGCGKGAKRKKLPATGGVKKTTQVQTRNCGSLGNTKVPKINRVVNKKAPISKVN